MTVFNVYRARGHSKRRLEHKSIRKLKAVPACMQQAKQAYLLYENASFA